VKTQTVKSEKNNCEKWELKLCQMKNKNVKGENQCLVVAMQNVKTHALKRENTNREKGKQEQ